MLFTTRGLMVVLLSLLLPLQASLAYARAVSMIACKSTATATGKEAGANRMIVTKAQHADALLEHASHAEHDHSPRNPASALNESVIKTVNHHASHAPSTSACDNCAKCCLTGAAAPPLIWPHASDMVAASVLFSFTSDNPSCFFPDGPERPPRCL